MIIDLNFGGVLIPGLVIIAFIALAVTMATMRFFAATGLRRLFVYRPLVELATFVIIFGLLMRYLPLNGLIP